LRGVDRGDFIERRGRARRRAPAIGGGVVPHQQRDVDGLRHVGQAEHIRRECPDLAHHLRCQRRRQQADLARRQGRCEADREPVAVVGGVEHVGAGRQCGREQADIGDELRDADGLAPAPGHDVLGMRVRDERNCRHGRCTPPLADLRR
jgi:hypothetical protein